GVSRADVVDVTVVGRAAANHVLAAGGIVEADHVAVGRWLAPAHVPPNRAEGEGEGAAGGAARSLEARPGVAAGPGHAAVSRAVHDVLAGAQAAGTLVHRRHVNPATALQVAGDLDVADKAGIELDGGPSRAVIGVNDVERAAPDGKVVVGDVHPPVEQAS